MSENPADVAMHFVQAINRQDVGALAALMTPEHQFTDSLGNAVRGREKMRAGWRGYFAMVPDYTLEINEAFVRDSVVLLLGTAGGTYAPTGQRWQTPAALRARIEDDQVAEWRVYADNEPLRKLMDDERS